MNVTETLSALKREDQIITQSERKKDRHYGPLPKSGKSSGELEAALAAIIALVVVGGIAAGLVTGLVVR